MKIRVRFIKTGYLKYLSQLDLVRLFTRAFSRTNIPIKFTEGFNPHPKFSIGNPLPLGTESIAEYMDVELTEVMDPKEFLQRLNLILPKDIQIIKAEESISKASLSSIIKWSEYEIRLMVEENEKRSFFENNLETWKELETIEITKKKKKGKKKIETTINILPLIGNILYKGIDEEGFIILDCLLKSGENGNLKPIELIKSLNEKLSLGIDLDLVMIKRLEAFVEEDGKMSKPL
ncbi:MAG: TIGR03936 family radical SAM-associated protein [Gudongella sp.]|nr:TIGR03936 family radical SAM-associated protein [Gudongella sp.]